MDEVLIGVGVGVVAEVDDSSVSRESVDERALLLLAPIPGIASS